MKKLMAMSLLCIALLSIDTSAFTDATPPSTILEPIGVSGTNGWFTSNVSLNITATDAGSGVKEIIYVIGGVSRTFTVTGGVTMTFTAVKPKPEITTEGTTEIQYYSRDNQGNTESTHIESISIDTILPQITSIVSSSGGGSNVLHLQFNVTETETNSTTVETLGNLIPLNVIGTNGQTLTYSANITMSNGTHDVNITSDDLAGNVGKASFNYTYSPPILTPTTGSGSGGGGGGGAGSLEDYSNIESNEKVDFNLLKDKTVTQIFKSNNLVYELAVVGANNEDFVTFKVEVLKGITKTTNKTPEGTVYKFLNIYSGTKRVREAIVRFKVDNKWLADNNIQSMSLSRLVSDQWTPLETTLLKKDDAHTYFEAGTAGFSSFAIVGYSTPTSKLIEITAQQAQPTSISPLSTQAPTKKASGFEVIFLVAFFIISYLLLRGKR